MSLRVVVVTPYFRPIVGGAESQAGRLAHYLQDNGFAVRVVTKRLTRALPDTEWDSGVTIHRIGPFGDRSATGKWLVVPSMLRWLIRHAGEHDVVCSVDYRGVGFAMIAARVITRRPVVFQAQTPGAASGANLDGVLARCRLAPDGVVARLVKWLLRTVYSQADAFACISREIERETLLAGVPRDRVHYLPNAIDMTRFSPVPDDERMATRRKLGLADGVVVCLFVGRLSREKGLMDLMEAWRLLNPSSAVLLIAGPDMPGHKWDVGAAAREVVDRYGLSPSVRFMGSIGDVVPLLRAADLAIQPSHFEALGLSAIEALACGTPVVATAVGGLLDFVVDDHNGRLCPPHDPGGLADCLRGLIADAPSRRRLSANARASVRDEYDEKAVLARFAALLLRLAEPVA